MKSNFASRLIQWSKSHHRPMPWKGEKDPYLIWLSEIILQQTRVEQGLPYFIRFSRRFPTVKHLALAKIDEVLKLWQGLGYYSRARNLHETAKHIYYKLGGIFPKTYQEIRQLKGVGDYTAAAIASFAFNEPRAVVDGNVIRVLSRVYGIKSPFDTTAGRKEFAALAQSLIDSRQPGRYNQAFMDFGAQVCTPKKPQCAACIFKGQCVAYQNELVDQLPFKAGKTAIRERWFHYFLIRQGKSVWIQKRNGNDIWKGLYELPMIESQKDLDEASVQKELKRISTGKKVKIHLIKCSSQRLSHRIIHFSFYECKRLKTPSQSWENAIKIPYKKIHDYPFPKNIDLFLKQNVYLRDE